MTGVVAILFISHYSGILEFYHAEKFSEYFLEFIRKFLKQISELQQNLGKPKKAGFILKQFLFMFK